MLTPALNTQSPEPLYRQLYAYVRGEIAAGRLRPGTRLPSKRRWAEHLGVSENTVQGAYDQLVDEGYVRSRERSGHFVEEVAALRHLAQIPQSVSSADVSAPPPRVWSGKEQPVPSETPIDFSYQGVDRERFPFGAMRRLLKDILTDDAGELLRPPEPQGYRPLRASIAAYLRHSRGVRCREEQVVVSSGTEFLFPILLQLLARDAVFGVENPGQERLVRLLDQFGSRWVPVDLDEDGVKLAAVRESGADVLCVTPSHQFPTGTIMPVQRRSALLEWAEAGARRFIIEDDYDSEFKYGGMPIPALQGMDRRGRVLYIGSFSKSLTPSLRVSYLVLPDQLLSRYRQRLSHMVCPVPLVVQKLLHRFVEAGRFERHLNAMRTVYKRKRGLVVDGLRALAPELAIEGADAGLHVVVAGPPSGDAEAAEHQLAETAQQAGVRVYPLSSYYHGPRARGADRPRVLLGYAALTPEQIQEGVRKLRQAWAGPGAGRGSGPPPFKVIFGGGSDGAAAVQTRIEQQVSDAWNRSWRMTTVLDRRDRASHPCAICSDGQAAVFVKEITGPDAEAQVKAEVEGLRAMRDLAGVQTPEVLGVVCPEDGAKENAPNRFFLLMEAVPEVSRGCEQWREIGRSLAALHAVEGERFGYAVPTYFGPLQQDNTPAATWEEFFVQRRLQPRLGLAVARGHLDRAERKAVEAFIGRVGELMGPEPRPTLLHGDAQKNNFVSTAQGPVLVDPAVFFGHPELDLAFLELFEAVPEDVYGGYAEVRPIDEGFWDRGDVWRMAGWLGAVAYDGSCIEDLRRVLRRYG